MSLFDSISDSMVTVIGIAALIVAVVLIIILLFSAIELVGNGIKNTCLWIAIAVAAFMSAFTMHAAGDELHDREYEHIVGYIENGYTLYVNGIEVDLSHITLEEYSLSAINIYDEVKEVHIAATENE